MGFAPAVLIASSMAVSAIVFSVTVVYITRLILNHKADKLIHHQQLEVMKTLVPLRVQAYERLVLLLERIAPVELLSRFTKPALTSRQLHAEIISAIRDEFTHNLSQQVYVSTRCWDKLIHAKEEVIKVFHTAFQQVDPESAGYELASYSLKIFQQNTERIHQEAITFLKAEAASFFDKKVNG